METEPDSQYAIKFRHIVPTLLTILVGSVVGLLLLRWLTSIQFDLLDIKEEIWDIWIPIIFPWIPITLWLRPRLRILTREKDAGNMQFGFQFLAWFVIGMPLIFSQAYLTSAVGDLIPLNNIADLNPGSRDKYYIVENFEVLPRFGASAEDIHTSGKYNAQLNINLYFTLPITRDSLDSPFKYNCWYGVKYHLQISNRIDAGEKERKYNDFYKACISKMDMYRFHDLQYFKRLPTSDDKEGFVKAIARIDPAQSRNAIILAPVREDFAGRNGNKLLWLFGSATIGILLFLFVLVWPKVNVMELEHQHAGKKTKEDDIILMFKYLIPKEPHFVTSIIMDINILVFLIMIFTGVHIISPNGLELLAWGANRRTEAMNGEWWRLFTSMFVHGGVMHLLLNIFGLFFASSFLEIFLGGRRYAIVYLLAGLCGSIASIWWHENTISVGASGAIFGLFGAIFSMMFARGFSWDGSKGILLIFGPYVGINLLFGLMGGIDNAAHIGGLLSGFLIGLIMFKYTGIPTEGEENNSQVS